MQPVIKMLCKRTMYHTKKWPIINGGNVGYNFVIHTSRNA